MYPANSGHALRLTPANSPFSKHSGNKSPHKAMRTEPGLSLKQVIGTTTCSPSGFDCLPSARSFAYTAGASAIVSTLDDNLEITQRFFRARPAAVAINSTPSAYSPATPGGAPQETRNRTVASLRDAGLGYSPNASPMGDWGESPGSKTWTARERIKAATCVSFSPDGRFLAVGETGYNPRVLLFSLANDESSDIPLTIISEHTFGIRCVAFSPDAKYLASLGTVNDGFLYIWSINSKTGAARLHSSNKCTSYIRDMIWMGNRLVTVGTRHVKVWKPTEGSAPQSPSKQRFGSDGAPVTTSASLSPRTLVGRNALLGSLVDTVFTCAAPIDDDQAVVCSEKGDVCLLDDTDGNQRLVKGREEGFAICGVAVHAQEKVLWVAGKCGQIRPIFIRDLGRPTTPDTPRSSPSPTPPTEDRPAYIVAMAFLENQIISIDSAHSIKIFDPSGKAVKNNPAHRDAVLGVKLLESPTQMAASFFTWSAGGNVRFWDLTGNYRGEMTIELEQLSLDDDDYVNELKVVLASPTADFFVSGDRSGVLRVIDEATMNCSSDIKAHGSEVTDVAISIGKQSTLVASSSRDRMVQLFRKAGNNLELLQTLDDHVGAVGRVIFSSQGDKLLSCSSDRTIVIRELVSSEGAGDLKVAFLPVRTVTLKATPLSMALLPEQPDFLLVSTADKSIQKIDIRNGRSLQTFRALDAEGNDAVIMDALVVGRASSAASKSILAGVSTTDKSVRLYDHRTGCLLDRACGHTEGVTDIALHQTEQGKTTLISTGTDSTIMIWDFSLPSSAQQDISDTAEQEGDTPHTKENPTSKSPLRRILSKSELAEWQRNSDAQNPATPTKHPSPPRQVRKKTSKYSLAQTAKLPPVPTIPFKYNSPTPSRAEPSTRKNLHIRSDHEMSPPTTSTTTTTHSSRTRRSSTEPRNRSKSSGNVQQQTSEFGGLNAATEQTCRALRAYRKKLNNNGAVNETSSLRSENIRELERELEATKKVLGERARRLKVGEEGREGRLEELLEGYSERLVDLIERKVEARVGGGMGVGKEGEEGRGADGEGDGGKGVEGGLGGRSEVGLG
ncbi:MAG: hypothetical protein M1812_004230 [Candelaria pacifica]|nr:MAG: hypothetical protein M1812_004230 [Candelaria pacifica]